MVAFWTFFIDSVFISKNGDEVFGDKSNQFCFEKAVEKRTKNGVYLEKSF